ncbi:MAG TPA: Gfo/Idh/MocA family oxidoreductase [Candidatus Limnocylindria bacterium]
MSEGTPATLRAGVIGLGSMGQHHARVWASLPGVELVAVADPRPEVLARATEATGSHGHADALAMLAASELDLVSVAAPTSLHCDLTVAALRAGAHVLVEKPIAADRSEAEAMMAAAATAGRLLSVGHVERFNPAIVELRRRLAAGELGRVFEVRAERLGPFPDRIRDVGVVVDLAPHDLDVMRFLLGADPVRVYAETEQRIHTEHEDLFVGVMKFANGAIGLLDINWLTPAKQRRLSVTGERGMYVADYLSQELTFFANPSDASVTAGPSEARPIQRREPLVVELEAFADAVRSGAPPPVEPREALIALQLARAMVEAANTGTALSGAALDEVLG